VKLKIIAAIAAFGLVSAGTASAAETRSSSAMPSARGGAASVNLSRASSATTEENDIIADLGIVWQIIFVIGGVVSVYYVAKTNG
jgi:hypothetical protein